MTQRCYEQLAQMLARGPVVLATVVSTQGSVPREVGAKMLVGADGCWGTIGGGAGEAKVIQTAAAVLAGAEPQLVVVNLTGRPGEEGICGGQMQVWLGRWQPAQLGLVRQIQGRMGTGGYLVMPLRPEAAPYLADTPEAEGYVEALEAPPPLLIVGAGHVGYALAHLAHWIGFAIAIQDDRPDYADPQRFPEARWCSHRPVAELLPELGRAPYIALVTRGLAHDITALEAIYAAALPYRYLGMIGSLKRVRTVKQTLVQRGVPAAALEALAAPIGLDIHALTPEEIAVSICAQLIQVRRQP